jgi:hypothetical protein
VLDENPPLLLSIEKEAAMPTVVHFVGAEEPVTLEDEYDRVNLQLRTEGKAGEFVRVIGENRARVTVYKSGIAYIEDASEAKSEPMLAAR